MLSQAATAVVAMTDPLQWQELVIFKDKPEDVTSVEVTHEGQPTISLTRDIPTGLNWLVGSFVEGVPKESLEFTLQSTRSAVLRENLHSKN